MLPKVDYHQGLRQFRGKELDGNDLELEHSRQPGSRGILWLQVRMEEEVAFQVMGRLRSKAQMTAKSVSTDKSSRMNGVQGAPLRGVDDTSADRTRSSHS